MAIEKAVEIRVNTQPATSSVKELRNELKRIKDEMAGLEEGSSAFLGAANRAGALKHQIDEINESVSGASADFGDMVSAVSKIGAGVTGAFGIATSTMQLFGVESEEVNKALETLNNTLFKIPIYLLAIDAGVKGWKKFSTSIETTDEFIKNLNADIQKLVESFRLPGDTIIGWDELSSKLKLPDDAEAKVKSIRDAEIEAIKALQKEWAGYRKQARKENKTLLEVSGKEEKDYIQDIFKIRSEASEKIKQIIVNETPLIQKNAIVITTFIERQLNSLVAFIKTIPSVVKSTIKTIWKILKANPILTTITIGLLTIRAAIEAIKSFSEKAFKNLISDAKVLNSVAKFLSDSIKSFSESMSKISSNREFLAAIDKQRNAIENLTNSYRQLNANKREEIELDRQRAQAGITGIDIKSAERFVDEVTERIRKAADKEKTGWFWDLLGESFIGTRADFEETVELLYKDFDFTKLVGMSDSQLKETAQDIVSNLNTFETQISPIIEGLQQRLSLIELDKDNLGKKTYELQKSQVTALLQAYQTYYESVQEWSKKAQNAITAEYTARQQNAELTKQEKLDALAVTKAQIERRKVLDENYEHSREYLIAMTDYLTQYRDLQRRGTQEWINADTALYEFANNFKRLHQEINDTIKDVSDPNNERIINYLKLTDQLQKQVTILNDTMARFGESSLGLTGSWQNVVSDFSSTFSQLTENLIKGENGWSSWTTMAATGIQSVGTLLNALSDEQDSNTKEGFEKQKKYQISASVMNMLAGILSAWTSAMTIPPPAGPILGAVNSAMIGALGAVQIAKIKSQQFGGDGASTSSRAINSTIIPPVDYSRLVQGAQTEGAIRDTRQYVSVVEIDNVQKRVNVSESEAKY